jgi:hypothetical protein
MKFGEGWSLARPSGVGGISALRPNSKSDLSLRSSASSAVKVEQKTAEGAEKRREAMWLIGFLCVPLRPPRFVFF